MAASPSPSANTPVRELPRQVQVESSRDDAARRKEVDTLLTSAERDLNRIAQGNLNAQGREDFKDTQSLLSAARKALSDRNFTLAFTNANKAAILAAALAAR